MSFRLRIFLLVLVVAGTAIGATAWLTLSLTSRELTQADQARDRHQAEIVERIRLYGLLHGNWPGIDTVVSGLSERTGLHIRVVTGDDDEVLTDSDVEAGREVGPVQLVSSSANPVPALHPMIMQRAAEQPVMANAKLLKLREARIKAAKGVPTNEPEAILPPPKLPSDLFGPIPTDGGFADPVAQALFQVAQYRAALATVRCTAQSKPVEPALDMELSPYLSKAQLSDTACVRQAMDKVRKDGYWLGEQYTLLADCALSRAADPYQNCLSGAFEQAAATATAAAPVEVFFGAQHRSPIDQLGRPALLGVIALLAVAAVGTAWIARRVSRPVRLLTGASRQLAEGRLDVRVPAEGQDELARLSASFNKMAQALQRSEERQRRLIADVAHEMRTPLSNLRGYLEGLASTG